MVRISAIVAMTADRLIGRGNDLPWHWPEDMRHFKHFTKGHTVVMGRRSWESMPGGLPDRTNVVISTSKAAGAPPDGLELEGALWFPSLGATFDWAARRTDAGTKLGEIFILGGGALFKGVLEPLDTVPAAGKLPVYVPERLVVTWVPDVPIKDDDVLFPYDRAWLLKHFQVKQSWNSESGELQFEVFERTPAR